jgi:hypothetical protein
VVVLDEQMAVSGEHERDVQPVGCGGVVLHLLEAGLGRFVFDLASV